MGKKTVVKSAALALLIGSAFQFGGCLGGKFWRTTFWDTVGHTTLEYILDNDAVFDLFEDDGAA